MSNKSKILVLLQFSAFGILLFNCKILANGVWLYIQILGLIITLLATSKLGIGNFNIQPEVKETAIFKQKGLYSYIRNPIYLGLIIYFTALIGNDYSTLSIITYIVLILVLLIKIQMEEKFLTKKFGNNYITYKKRTKRLIPFIY